MGEQPPVHGIHDDERTSDFHTGTNDVFVVYDPESPDGFLAQGGGLQVRGPSIR